MNVVEKTINFKITKENVIKFTDRTENKLVNILVAKGEKGDKGADGTVAFESLTEEQRLSLKGDKGDKGDKGNTGKTGADGYTPVKGTDYYTEADKQEIVSLVLEALPSFEEVSY